MPAKKHSSERKVKPSAHVVGRSLRPIVRQDGPIKIITYSKADVRKAKSLLPKCPGCGDRPIILSSGINVFIKCRKGCRTEDKSEWPFIGAGGWTLEEAIVAYKEKVGKYVKRKPLDINEVMRRYRRILLNVSVLGTRHLVEGTQQRLVELFFHSE